MYMIIKYLVIFIVCRRGDIRPLTFGSSPSMGIVEVCLGERFLPVRQSDFTVAEANVICRQLDLGSGNYGVTLGDCI